MLLSRKTNKQTLHILQLLDFTCICPCLALFLSDRRVLSVLVWSQHRNRKSVKYGKFRTDPKKSLCRFATNAQTLLKSLGEAVFPGEMLGIMCWTLQHNNTVTQSRSERSNVWLFTAPTWKTVPLYVYIPKVDNWSIAHIIMPFLR